MIVVAAGEVALGVVIVGHVVLFVLLELVVLELLEVLVVGTFLLGVFGISVGLGFVVVEGSELGLGTDLEFLLLAGVRVLRFALRVDDVPELLGEVLLL